MRTLLRSVLTTVAATGAVVLAAGTAQAAAFSPAQLASVTDGYVFSTSLPDFTAIRATTPYADQLDWTSDACSYSPDAPFGYAFTPACERHDFGYRNTKAQGRFTADQRLAIDRNFRTDLYEVCGASSGCRATADTYYHAVRAFGGAGTTASAVDASGVIAAA